MTSTIRVAAVQAEPVWLDLAATVAKTITLIEQAATAGADLIAFPETWLPGYPIFLWTHPVTEQIPYFARYHANSPTVDGSEIGEIRSAAAQHGITVVIGYSEKAHGSLYISQSVIGPDGAIVLHRRKLKPTHAERTLFGEGDGSDLLTVETSLGTIGALNCWEHIQPLFKFSLFADHEQIHIAAWPCFGIFGNHDSLGSEASMAVSRTYALEGGAFVIVASQLLSAKGAMTFAVNGELPPAYNGGGGLARVYGPSGGLLTEPLPFDEEGLAVADIDLTAIDIAKSFADPVGHYSRPDIFDLKVDRTARVPAQLSHAHARATGALKAEVPLAVIAN